MALLKFDRVISGDSHVREPVDLWMKTMGAKFGDRTPRPLTEHEGRKGNFFFTGQRVSKHGVAVKPEDQRTEEENLILRSGYDPVVRLEFQRRAGIAAEIIYPSLTAQIIAIEDAQVAQAACRVYNDWIAEFCSSDPKRLVGASVVPVHDIDWAVAEVKRTAAKGLRGVLVNVVPPQNARPYVDRAYDTLWATCQELDAPVILHIITGQEVDPLVYFHDEKQYAQATRCMFAVWNEVQETLANDFIFGGILDRFPTLKVLCGEYELSWLPHFMFRMDQVQDDFSDYIKLPKLKMRASDYMKTRVYHGMIDDPEAQLGFDKVGYGQVLWGSDFPHVRSIGIETQSRLSEMLSGIPKDVQLQLVGGNAARLFNL
jgi:predicted TIM-barrel fold metal-dependent hydrolase